MDSQVLTLLLDRKATRSIDTKPVSAEMLEVILQAARMTPSCRNKQPWRFLVATSENGLKKTRTALTGGNTQWAVTAPVLIVGYSKVEDDCVMADGREYHQFDLGMATMNLMLAATEMGLVARPMSGFTPETIRDAFELSENDLPHVMVAIGYPGTDDSHLPDNYRGMEKKPRVRKEIDEIVKRV